MRTPRQRAPRRLRPSFRWTGCHGGVSLLVALVIALGSGVAGNAAELRPAAAARSAGADGAAGVSQEQARGWIRRYGAGAANVAANMADVRLALGQLRRSSRQANIDQLAAIAQTALTGIELGSRFEGSGSDTLPRVEQDVVAARRALTRALSAMVAYADRPSPTTLTRMTALYAAARIEWNRDVRAIWRAAARRSQPPNV